LNATGAKADRVESEFRSRGLPIHRSSLVTLEDVPRLLLAAGMTLVAIRRRWGWLAYVAATIAVPTLWLARLAPLVAVPRLWWEERQDARALATEPAAPERLGPAPATG